MRLTLGVETILLAPESRDCGPVGNVHYSHSRYPLDSWNLRCDSNTHLHHLARQTRAYRLGEFGSNTDGQIWWSIWLTVLWVGFWAATAIFMILPTLWRNIIGSIIPNAKAYTDIVAALGKYAKLIIWTIALWASFTPLIINNYGGPATDADGNVARARSDLSTFVNILFGLVLCSIVLGVEKLIIQLIA